MILAIIQARMSSKRLPGKVMMKVLQKPLIGYLIERLKSATLINKIVVATSTNPSNDVLCSYLEEIGVEIFRGDENNVLDRFYQTAVLYHPQAIVRITADCPLLDYKVIDKVIQCYLNNDFDYVSNITPRTYPLGLDVEIFSFQSLEKTWKEVTTDYDKEHVTPYIKNSPSFKRGNFQSEIDYSSERWTLDYQEDFALISSIITNLYNKNPDFDMNDILNFKKNDPELFRVNSQHQRYEGSH